METTKVQQRTLADLLGGEAVEWEDARIAMHLLPDLPCPLPSAEMRENVAAVGVLVPVLLVDYGDGFGVLDGRRRIKAARIAAVNDVPARIASSVQGGGAAAITLATNELRSSNPAAELESIEELVRRGLSESEIARVSGMSVQTVRKRVGLLRLLPPLLDAFRAGKILPSAAEAAAKLPHGTQEKIAAAFAESGRVTLAVVEEARRVRADGAIDALPSGLFSDPEPVRGPSLDSLLGIGTAKDLPEIGPLLGNLAEAAVELGKVLGRGPSKRRREADLRAAVEAAKSAVLAAIS